MAPIAFLILFAGTAMLQYVSPTDDSTGSSTLLRSLFYAITAFAAVYIPLELGGRLLGMVFNPTKRAGAMGAKAGLGGLATAIPTTGGKSLGQRIRTGRAFVEGRKKYIEQEAALSAEEARIGMGGSAIGRNFAGTTQGQQTAALESITNEAVKQMVPYGLEAKRRIVNAHKYGTRRVNGQNYALAPDENNGGRIDLLRDGGPMSDDEVFLSRKRVNAGAAYRELAQGDLSETHMLAGANNFANTGYQQLHHGNPVIFSTDRAGRVNEGTMRLRVGLMGADDIKKTDTDVMEGALHAADPNERRQYLSVMRHFGGANLANAVDSVHRDRFSTPRKRELTYQLAQTGALVHAASTRRVLDEEFNGNIALHQEHINAQRAKQRMIINRYEEGVRRVGTTG